VDDRIFEAACRQTGILRLDGWNELFEIPKIFATQPLPAGSRLGVVSYTGGMGVLAMDQCAGHGLEVTKLTPETCVRLNGLFQGLGKMPVDIGPMAPAVDDFFSLYPKILQQVLSDDNVDMLFNILWADPAGMGTDVYPDAYERFLRDKGVPLATWIYGPDPGAIGDLTQRLEDLGYPVFSSPELCVKALGMAARFSEIRRRGGGGPPGSLRGGEQSHEHG
jgi:acetyltransferase